MLAQHAGVLGAGKVIQAKAENAAYLGSVQQKVAAAQSMNSAADQIARLEGIAQANTAESARQAEIQRDWQVKQNSKAMLFNASEAAKNRDWQEMMSNTAHQREVKDLLAAGLNPVLSAMNGNGAAVTSGATASGVTSQGAKGEVDTSLNGAIANLLGSILAANTQLQAAAINARSQEAIAAKYTAMEQLVAEIQSETSRYSSDQSAAASRYSSDTNYDINRKFGQGQITAAAGILKENVLDMFPFLRVPREFWSDNGEIRRYSRNERSQIGSKMSR